MKTGHSQIAVILDRSASMQEIAKATVDGFNEFVGAQKSLPGTADLMLVQFDHEYQFVYNRPIREVPHLSLGENGYQPRGWTALLDAIGRTIDDVGSQLAKLPENERPEKVIIVVLTDGMENQSKEYITPIQWDANHRALNKKTDRVFSMIKHQREVYRWDILFLGANQDAIAVAGEMGVPQAAALTYTASAGGVKRAMHAASTYTSSVRGGHNGELSEQDRHAALHPEDTLAGAKR